MKANAIVLDLDDTLLSTHYRQYACLRDYLVIEGMPFMLFEDYLKVRRLNNLSNTDLLKALQVDLDWKRFTSYYLNNIESERYLDLDELIVDKVHLSLAVQKKLTLILLSLRGNATNSLRQMGKLGIDVYFKDIYFEPHNNALNPKLGRLNQLIKGYDIIAFCGDSVSDYEAARHLNINFVQVKTSLYALPDFEQAEHYDNINEYLSKII